MSERKNDQVNQKILDVDILPNADRLKQAKKQRVQQIKRWNTSEKCFEKLDSKTNMDKMKKTVKFANDVIFLDSAAKNDLDEVRRLLLNGVSPDAGNEDGLTALHQCCIDNNEVMCRLLLEFHASVDAQDSEHWTPLHAAAACGHANLCLLLIEHGADLLAINLDGNMPYDLCENDAMLDVLEQQMHKLCIVQSQIDEKRFAAEKSMLTDMEMIVEQQTSIDYKNERGVTPLHIAASNGYLKVVEFLLQHGASTDIKDCDGWMAIHIAVFWNYLKIIRLLLLAGADFYSKTNYGETILDLCEDCAQKQQLIELKKEVENSSLVQKISTLHDGHENHQGVSIHRTSVRRSSARNKQALSMKEVYQEAQLVISSFTHNPDNAPSNGLDSPLNFKSDQNCYVEQNEDDGTKHEDSDIIITLTNCNELTSSIVNSDGGGENLDLKVKKIIGSHSSSRSYSLNVAQETRKASALPTALDFFPKREIESTRHSLSSHRKQTFCAKCCTLL